jgi:CheY-like chemotaxis protein
VIQSVLRRILIKRGAQVRLASNGRDGYQLALEVPQPDIILSDVTMPEMSGFEMCSQLRNRPSTKHIPVVFLSSLEDTRNVLAGMRVGAADYLSKNKVQPDHLTQVLLRAFERSRSQPRAAASPTFGFAGIATAEGSPSTPPMGTTVNGIGPHRDQVEEEGALLAISSRGQRLTRGEDAHMAMLKSASVGVMVYDLYRQLIYINRRGACALGIPEAANPRDIPGHISKNLLDVGIALHESGRFSRDFLVRHTFEFGLSLSLRLECLTAENNEMTGVFLLIG